MGIRVLERLAAVMSISDTEPVLAPDPRTDPFEIEPVPLDVFLHESAYLGLPDLSKIQREVIELASNVYPKWINDKLGWSTRYVDILVCLFGKSSGKDFISRVSILRIIYLLLCLRSPQMVYGLTAADAIDAINMAYTAYQARAVFFNPLIRMVTQSPFFRGRSEVVGNQIQFDKALIAHSGNSSQESFEGFNPIVVALDEIDAFKTREDLRRSSAWNPEHSAEGIYNSLRSSTQSRFPGLGKMLLLSFLRRSEGYMIDTYNKMLNDPTAYARRAATWEVNPTKTRSDFDVEYRRNPEDSAMRYECIPTATASHFFRDRPVLYRTFHYDEVHDSVLSGVGIPVNPFQDGAFLPSFRISENDVRPRFIHVDTGITNDAAAVGCVHVDSWIEIEGGGVLPVIGVDFLATLDPLAGHQEIKLEEIRDVIRKFRNCRPLHKVSIGRITFDQYQSRDSMQILTSEGYVVGYLSVDKDDTAYVTLKDVIYTGRLRSPGSLLLVKELRSLVKFGNKVDHPPGGSKDLADALAGAVTDLYDFIYTNEPSVIYDEGMRVTINY